MIVMTKAVRVYKAVLKIGWFPTLKAFDAPSIATDTGPTLATAAFKFDSLPLEMDTFPEMLAPRFFLL